MQIVAFLMPFIIPAVAVMVVWSALRRKYPAISLSRAAGPVIGLYAGLLGAEHGFFETLQGRAVPGSFMISAIGAPCIPDEIWHACEPAMTIIPSFLMTGILAMLCALVMIFWSFGFLHKKHGGLVMILLSIGLLLVGGGFFPPLFGMIAGVTGMRIKPNQLAAVTR